MAVNRILLIDLAINPEGEGSISPSIFYGSGVNQGCEEGRGI